MGDCSSCIIHRKANGDMTEQEEIREMARTGYFFDNKYEVYVHADDPNDEFDTCVTIGEAVYFRRWGKTGCLEFAYEKRTC